MLSETLFSNFSPGDSFIEGLEFKECECLRANSTNGILSAKGCGSSLKRIQRGNTTAWPLRSRGPPRGSPRGAPKGPKGPRGPPSSRVTSAARRRNCRRETNELNVRLIENKKRKGLGFRVWGDSTRSREHKSLYDSKLRVLLGFRV